MLSPTQVVQLQNLSVRARGHHRRTLDALIASGRAYAAWDREQRIEHLTKVEFAVSSLLWCVTSPHGCFPAHTSTAMVRCFPHMQRGA